MKAKLHKHQMEVATDTHRFKIICAGRRWGKSVLSGLIVLKWATEEVGIYWIVSPTFGQGKDIHWAGLLKMIPPTWIKKSNETTLTIELVNGSVIVLKSAENPNSLRGSGLRGLVIDEIASIRDWNWLWKECLRPALTDYRGKAVFISTPMGFNHFYDLYRQGLVEGENDYKSWHFTTYDNPYISTDEIEAAKKELPEDAFQQEYMADFRKFTGLVYKDFERHHHVRDIPDFQAKYYLRGLDRGYNNPTAVVYIAVDKDDNWYQIDEIYQTGLINPELQVILTDKTKELNIEEFELSTMDSAQVSDINELAQLGEDFAGVKKESGEPNVKYVLWKIQKFAERLKIKDGKSRYYVHPRCVNTIMEFEHYEWKQQGDTLQDNPLKLNDHAMDALADLNSMYIHMYEKEKKAWDGKIPTTYIEPSVKDEDENEWATVSNYGNN